MYIITTPKRTTLRGRKSVEGETIEQKVDRVMHSGEPITDGAPQNFTDRKDGVRPEFDIRTDRWELATEAMDQLNRDAIAKRDNAGQSDATKGADDKPGAGKEPGGSTDSKE